ncbi:MAG TPA: sialidase family protein [Verrucomicrobiae bacterium]|nr:sialidase family protein [Verrucomicrobiae bacterium]
MAQRVLLLVGTKKGLFFLGSEDRVKWQSEGPFLPGKEINHAARDPRTGRIFATSNDAWFGSEISWSADNGKTWQSAKKSPGFPEGSNLKLDRIWHIEPGRAGEPGVLYAGVAPATLFRSEDNGETWNEVTGLSSHPTRSEWHPGAGGLCLHSIVLDHNDANRMFVGISAVGVFRSNDNGATWSTANRGTRAEFMPNKYPEYGQCVHKLLMAPGPESLLFQQNHCGVYRSADGGLKWEEITAGLPSDFGFPLGIHPRDPRTIYVLPLQGGEFRCPPEGKLRVFRSRDGGNHWESLANGLPQERVFAGNYREGMTVDSASPAGIYFGTNTGKIFGSRDEGDSWHVLADNLPPVYSVEAAMIDG